MVHHCLYPLCNPTLKSEVAHDHRGSLGPRIKVVLNLHNQVWVTHNLSWHRTHLLVWYFPLIKDLAHLHVRGRLELVKGTEAEGHVDLRLLITLLRIV